MRLSSAVLFVRDLELSVAFYSELLEFVPTVRTATAALLVGPEHYQLYLRAMRRRDGRETGTVGIQYVIWAAETLEDLDRSENVLRRKSKSVTREQRDGFDVVQGSDPDDGPVVIVFPGPDHRPRDQIIPRIYTW
ncbi:VOC family protein [Microbacterium hatanonis]|uniref:VOC domain-containing protein n=1 Tax=Microbacterium hatanonis TaxID=404366 RepID=A0A5C8I2A4_9MICO|nr:VOC family protein [Microbacterium hatanonis]TXK12341.1 hypothetical protein FVP77_02350 [Microbacterium hatanonis]